MYARHQPRETRGPIETRTGVASLTPSIPGHQPRETRGPIETECGVSREGSAKIAGHQPRETRGPIETLRLVFSKVLQLICHQPRETRGPIETFGRPTSSENRQGRRSATSRAKRAALLKLEEELG